MKAVDELVAVSLERYVPPAFVAVAYLGVEDYDEVFRWLDKESTVELAIWAIVPLVRSGSLRPALSDRARAARASKLNGLSRRQLLLLCNGLHPLEQGVEARVLAYGIEVAILLHPRFVGKAPPLRPRKIHVVASALRREGYAREAEEVSKLSGGTGNDVTA